MFALSALPVPVAVAVAMFQRRLYDVQLVVSRTLTYVALSALLAGVYAMVVVGVGRDAAGPRRAVAAAGCRRAWSPWPSLRCATRCSAA